MGKEFSTYPGMWGLKFYKLNVNPKVSGLTDEDFDDDNAATSTAASTLEDDVSNCE